MKKFFTGFCDMYSGKPLETGHIVAVRYNFSSYVGQIFTDIYTGTRLYATESGAKRHAFFSPHILKTEYTYQIISHINPLHEDYIKKVTDWYNNEEGECPIEITVYQNCESYEEK